MSEIPPARRRAICDWAAPGRKRCRRLAWSGRDIVPGVFHALLCEKHAKDFDRKARRKR